MRHFKLVCAISAIAACFVLDASSQIPLVGLNTGGGDENVRFSAEIEPADARPGEYVQLRMKAEIEDGWYIYASDSEPPVEPTRINVNPGPLELVETVSQPTPIIVYDKGFNKQIGIHRSEAVFTQTLRVPENIQPGQQTVSAVASFTKCTSTQCIPLNTAQMQASLNIEAGEARKARAEAPAPPRVRISASFEPAYARAGEYVQLRIEANIQEGWFIYSLEDGPQPTNITLDMDVLKREGSAKQSNPFLSSKKDDTDKIGIFRDVDDAVFTQALFIPKDTKPGVQKVTAVVSFQPCNETQCFAPKTIEQEIELTVKAGDARDAYAQPPDSSGGGTTVDALSKARSEGLLAYIGFAMSMGFLSLLTPCVFPMIPITVSFFTKKEGLTRAQGVGQAFIYCLGIMITFTALGVLLSIFFGAASIQSLATNVWVNLLIAAIFIFFALNLFGAFEITVPHWLLNAFGGSRKGVGHAATIMMGLTFSLTTFTCTVPFVGTVLVAASKGEYFWAIIGMLSFSAAFSSPFFLLALFPQILSSLPKSGAWLNSIKVTMGFLELAAALKFISNIDLVLEWDALPRELFLAVWIAIALVAAIYLLGKIKLPHDTSLSHLGPIRLIASISFFAATLYLFTGLMGNPLGELDAFLPYYAMKKDQTPEIHDNWHESLEDALAEAKDINRPVFVDFTGVTCGNCRWMEKNIFVKKGVSDLLNRYVGAQIWTDKGGEASREASSANRKMQEERFGTTALPYYVLLSPDNKVIDSFDGLTRNSEKFKMFLQGGLDAFESNKIASANP